MKILLSLTPLAGLLLCLAGCSNNKGLDVPKDPVKINTKDIVSEEELLKQQAQKK